MKLGISKSEFCRRTLLSEKTYERIKYGQLADRPKPETVMQFCVGLGLSLEESENLFNAAGYYLGGCKLHEAYRELLSMNDSLTIYECNDVLRHLELPLLARWIEIS
ncbi:helix-turn-helix domain-containing protein [Adlercreutzia sp.]|uniref:helix-turn-helix domain-containing protein n=1 Tax=Adlercreutzia sp. TaxID=1872387 RepID=UPI0026719666|nr:helix-turn-helix domain-containing protein [uncultured Adlercreutzia sp.]